ncbi:MAG: hypothetical protein ACYS0E_14315 [Planctomycetota bacterium]|jgi:hypothetical protein
MVRNLVVLALLFATADPSRACQICYPLPKKSIADFLIEGETVLLAREDPDRPFHYRSIRVLKGVAPSKPLELFLDSGTRRVLKADPTRSVLLVKTSRWQRLAVVDQPLRIVVDGVLQAAPRWKQEPAARIDYFAKLFAHDNAVTRDLADLELARAPYAKLRQIGRQLPRARIRATLADGRYMQWWALHILLLGQSEDARDKKLIRDTVQSMARFHSPLHLGAWATAYVEIDPDKAIDFFETNYFRQSRSLQELRQVALAFSVQGKLGHRDRIVASYKVLLDKHPALVSVVLDDLIAWRRTETLAYLNAFEAKHARSMMPDARFKLRRLAALR